MSGTAHSICQRTMDSVPGVVLVVIGHILPLECLLFNMLRRYNIQLCPIYVYVASVYGATVLFNISIQSWYLTGSDI